MPAAKTVDAYLAAQPPLQRKVLAQVRATLRKALPKAEEVISYSMPAYRLHGYVVVFFAGWKEHVALYPVTPPIAQQFAAELAGYEQSKGTVRFPLDQKLPTGLITRLAKHMAERAAERAAVKAARAKPKSKPKKK